MEDNIINDKGKQFKRVGTHSGRFHADEVMATAILKQIFDIEVVRTRDPGVLNSLELIYDVGGGEFDHHQVEKEYRESGTPYAACGLIWRKFGREVVVSRDPELLQEMVDAAFQYTDVFLIEGIDAIDNGLRTCETIIPTMNISSVISGFNPQWDSDVSEDAAFNEAVDFASAALNNIINQQISVMKARAHIIKAYNDRVRPEVLILDKAYPWMSNINSIDTGNEVLFVIYPRDGQYLIQTVRENGGGYRDRKSLPQSWAGKRDEELNRIVGINDAVFCHPSRFIAGARSLESVLKMADAAISEPDIEDAAVPYGFLTALRKFLLKKRLVIKR